MTWNPNTPASSQSPGLFPAQQNTNNAVLQTNLDRDHIYGVSPSSSSPPDNSGTHRQVTLTTRADPTILPIATNGVIYWNNGLPQFFDGTSIYQTPPMRARVSWDNTGTIIGTSFNVSSVVKVSSGIFNITFIVPIPSIYPQFSVSCIEPSTNVVIPKISFTQLGSTMTVMTVKLFNLTPTLINPIVQANLIVYGG